MLSTYKYNHITYVTYGTLFTPIYYIADIMDAPHTHVLTTTDRMVGRAGDALGTLNT